MKRNILRIFKIAEFGSLYTTMMFLFIGALFNNSDPSPFLKWGSIFIWGGFLFSFLTMVFYGLSRYHFNRINLFDSTNGTVESKNLIWHTFQMVFKIAQIGSLYTITILLFIGALVQVLDPAVFSRWGYLILWLLLLLSLLKVVFYILNYHYSRRVNFFNSTKESSTSKELVKHTLPLIFKTAQIVSLHTIIILLSIGALFHSLDIAAFLRWGSPLLWIAFSLSFLAVIFYMLNYLYSSRVNLFDSTNEFKQSEKSTKQRSREQQIAIPSDDILPPKGKPPFYDPSVARPQRLYRESQEKRQSQKSKK